MTKFPTLLIAASALSACTVEPQNPSELGADPDGLHITAQDETGVRGTFAKNGTLVAFELATDGDVHHVRLNDLAGRSLFDTAVDESTDPAKVFDPGQLGGLPEAQLLGPLAEALRIGGDGLDPTVVSHTHATADGAWPSWSGCNSWVAPGNGAICGSVFFGYTSIYVDNYWSGSLDYIHSWSQGFAAPPPGEMGTAQFVGPYSQLSLGGWWWGQYILVYNDGPNWIYVTH